MTPGITDQAELEADAKAAPKLSESEIAALEAKALSMVKQNTTGWQVIENGNVVYTFTTYKKAIEVARTMVAESCGPIRPYLQPSITGSFRAPVVADAKQPKELALVGNSWSHSESLVSGQFVPPSYQLRTAYFFHENPGLRA